MQMQMQMQKQMQPPPQMQQMQQQQQTHSTPAASPGLYTGDPCSFEGCEARNVKPVVDALYFQFKEMCTETGIRFHSKEKLQAHKDAVFA